MSQQIFIGIDGGATKSVIRIEDEIGNVLGIQTSGPANIRLSVDQAWQSINTAINQILSPLALSNHHKIHVGMGLAGCEINEAYQEFMGRSHLFSTLVVSSDAHTACLGAHQGEDGAIIIVGTGVVGYQIENEKIAKISGWGFPHDDEGGGAWLGLQAIKETLRWLDGRILGSELTKAIYNHFEADQSRLIYWANKANSTAFAELAPIVIKQSEQGDETALKIVKEAAKAVDLVGLALVKVQMKSLPCALIGSIAPYLQPYLTAELRERIYPCKESPATGAIFLVKNYLLNIR